MAAESLQFLSAILLISEDPARLARFYRDGLGVPLEEEQHGDTALHWGCTLGDVHFAIHPVGNFPGAPEPGVGAVRLAFTVFDLDAYVAALSARGVELLDGPEDRGWCRMAVVCDPDGNTIELTQLSDGWFIHLEGRRAAGLDVIARWKQSRGGN